MVGNISYALKQALVEPTHCQLPHPTQLRVFLGGGGRTILHRNTTCACNGPLELIGQCLVVCQQLQLYMHSLHHT
jgi:hypothetical protein